VGTWTGRTRRRGVAGNNLTEPPSRWWQHQPRKLTVQGNVYTEGDRSAVRPHHQQGNVKGWGGWLQGGYDFTPRWSVWGFYGMDDPKEADSPGSPRGHA